MDDSPEVVAGVTGVVISTSPVVNDPVMKRDSNDGGMQLIQCYHWSPELRMLYYLSNVNLDFWTYFYAAFPEQI